MNLNNVRKYKICSQLKIHEFENHIHKINNIVKYINVLKFENIGQELKKDLSIQKMVKEFNNFRIFSRKIGLIKYSSLNRDIADLKIIRKFPKI